jgi:alkylation response protein AidB-like acyl-CoA dehydrogenase
LARRSPTPSRTSAAAAYEKFGTEEQKKEVLAGVTRGRVQSISMAEPEAGSDVS